MLIAIRARSEAGAVGLEMKVVGTAGVTSIAQHVIIVVAVFTELLIEANNTPGRAFRHSKPYLNQTNSHVYAQLHIVTMHH